MKYLRLVRINHLIKNLLVFAPMAFSLSFTWESFIQSSLAFLAFSCTAIAVYIMNDIFDIDQDKLHPQKKLRPIASGAISPQAALLSFVIFFLLGFFIAWHIRHYFFFIVIAYFLMNFCYSKWLKKVSIIDVMVIAIGFVMRILAGAASIAVLVSPWILLCTFFGALFIAFGKRKGEMDTVASDGHKSREVLLFYSQNFLNQLITTAAAITIMCYALYTIDENTILHYGTPYLIYTIPFVVFGIYRYFQLIYTKSSGEDPTKVFSSDLPILINLVLWATTFSLIVFFK